MLKLEELKCEENLVLNDVINQRIDFVYNSGVDLSQKSFLCRTGSLPNSLRRCEWVFPLLRTKNILTYCLIHHYLERPLGLSSLTVESMKFTDTRP